MKPAAERTRATLADIAEVSGVAISTVSRALSQPGRVNAATRARIQKAAENLDYVPASRAAQSAPRRTRAIAVLVSDITNPYYFDIIRGTQHQLKAVGYTQVLLDTDESDELEDEMLRTLRHSFDGAILAASRLTDRRLTALAEEMPLVAVNRQTRGVPHVFIDSPAGFEQALGHLVSLGHRDIGYMSGPETSWPNEARWRALVRANKAHGASLHRLGPFVPRMDSGADAADAAIAAGITACVAYNDLIAIGMLARFAERGVRVPEDVSVVGCDDIFGADFCHPPLTTLTQPIEHAARTAVAMLVSRLDAPARPGAYTGRRDGALLPAHLTVRASTGPVSGERPRGS